jgi:ketosteroid isomerase-like protein
MVNARDADNNARQEARMNRMRWSVLVAGCVVVLAVFALGAGAAQSNDLKPMVQKYWQLWQSGPDAAAPLYAKDPDLVFYDLEPLKYVGWAQYKQGVVPNILAKFERVAFTVNDDVKTTTRGDVAWTSATVQADGVLKASGPIKVTIRHTAIWEKRGGQWLIVHEHVSVPSALPAASK